MQMPSINTQHLKERDRIAADLRRCCRDPNAVITDAEGLRPYETDGFSIYRQVPLAVVLPSTTAEVQALLRYCHEHAIKVVARGAGTSLTGGALPLADSVVIGVAKMNRVLEVDYPNRAATVQAGVTNMAITQAVAGRQFFYAPDPSSQITCTIGGNVGMNSGGAHCLRYGVTANNLLGLKMVTMTGEMVEVGGKHLDAGSYDLLGVICGSEGTFGVITEVTVRILRAAEGARPLLMGFASNEAAGACVADIIASGIIPVALEFMDRPAIHACERFAKAGYPLDVEALLIVEVEGSEAEIDALLEKIQRVAQRHNPQTLRVSRSPQESAAIWKGRKAAFGAIGQICPDYFCIDGTIPTGQLPVVLTRIEAMAQEAGFQVANIFHAGDGNLHPLILFDANQPGETERAEALGCEILKLCVDVGGCLTGEHGVGIEKRDLMPHQFSPQELAQQQQLKAIFDPKGLLNSGKIFPVEAAEIDASDRAA